MLKFAKLKEIKEKVKIEKFTTSTYNVKTKEEKKFETLSFDIEFEYDGKTIGFTFELNCPLEDLLKIEAYKTIDFNDYIYDSGRYISVDGKFDLDPFESSKITRWIKNKFIIEISLFGETYFDDGNTDYYAGKVEIDLDLDEFLN